MNEMNYEKLCERVSTPHMRAVYTYIKPGCYVECRPDKDGFVQGGTVKKIIKDKYGIPVCVQVDRTPEGNERKRYDYISMERVWFFEPYDEWVSDYSDFVTKEEMDESMAKYGYYFDEKKCCYINPETGDELGW